MLKPHSGRINGRQLRWLQAGNLKRPNQKKLSIGRAFLDPGGKDEYRKVRSDTSGSLSFELDPPERKR